MNDRKMPLPSRPKERFDFFVKTLDRHWIEVRYFNVEPRIRVSVVRIERADGSWEARIFLQQAYWDLGKQEGKQLGRPLSLSEAQKLKRDLYDYYVSDEYEPKFDVDNAF